MREGSGPIRTGDRVLGEGWQPPSGVVAAVGVRDYGFSRRLSALHVWFIVLAGRDRLIGSRAVR